MQLRLDWGFRLFRVVSRVLTHLLILDQHLRPDSDLKHELNLREDRADLYSRLGYRGGERVAISMV
jgi:hypothetical protein